MLLGQLACSAELACEQQRKTLNVTKQKLTVKESGAAGEEVSLQTGSARSVPGSKQEFERWGGPPQRFLE